MSVLKAVLLDPKIVIYLFNLAVAASFVCGAGLLVARACRRRPAPVRHGILVGTLALVLLSPGAVWVGQISGLTRGLVTISAQADSAGHSERTLWEARGVAATLQSTPAATAHFQGASDGETSASPPITSPPIFVCSWHGLGTMLAIGWIVGILVHVIRLAWGYRVIGSFRHCLEEVVEPRVRSVAEQAAEAVGTRDAPRIFRSPFVPAPFCLGMVKPVIVVPGDILRELDNGQLRAILIHETAHLARRDTWVSLAQRVAVLLFWWNVLVYRLRDQIAGLREDICDNYVCRSQRDVAGFAKTLVGFAARATAQRFLPTTLGILEPAGLKGRVIRLLNKERNMATRMSVVSRGLVLTWTGAVLVAIVFAGGLRVAHSGPVAEEAAKATGEKPAVAVAAASTTEKAKEQNTATRIMRVRVVGPDGKPIVGTVVQAHAAVKGQRKAISGEYVCDVNGQAVVDLPQGVNALDLVLSKNSYLTLSTGWDLRGPRDVPPLPQVCTIKLTKLNPAQAKAVAEIEKLGGAVNVQQDGNGRQVTLVSVGEQTTDAGLEPLHRLPDPDALWVVSPNVSDAGLAHLESLHNLRTLLLVSEKITDAGLANLEGLQALKSLQLVSPKITDAGLTHLQRLHALEELTLNCAITDAGMKHLAPLKELKKLISCGVKADPATRNLIRALEQPTEIQCKDAPLRDICNYLGDYHGIKVQIENLSGTVPVSWSVKNVPLGQALHPLLGHIGLDWIVERGTLNIATRDVVAKKHSELIKLQQALPNLKSVIVDW